MEVIEGTLSRIIRQFDNGFTIAVIEPYYDKVVGNLPPCNPGDKLAFHGKWENNLEYGMQFKFEHVSQVVPDNLAGVQNFLAQLPNIGPVRAEAIIDEFGENIFEILENGYHQLTKIPGITLDRAVLIQDKWENIKSNKDTFLFLEKLGCTRHERMQIIECYRENTIAKLKENPYRMINDIKGFGFKTVDRMALKMGIKLDSIIRAKAVIEYVLQTAAEQNQHTYMHRKAVYRGADNLCIPASRAFQAIEELAEEETVISSTGGKKISLSHYYYWEQDIAGFLRQLSTAESNNNGPPSINPIFSDPLTRKTITLNSDQIKAVEMACRHNVSLITGLPGTGKTTLLNAILNIYKFSNIKLASPTGKAAKRMEETTGLPASTIHRLLEYDPYLPGFKRSITSPLQADMVVIDEASMLDVWLAQSLLQAIKPGTKLILVGDADQLPSVGPGNVLADLLSCKWLPSIELTEIMRQAKESVIIKNAHRINIGFPLELSSEKDFFFIEEEEDDLILKRIRQLVTQKIPKKLGLNPHEDIQVLCPQNVGSIGSIKVNRTLQRFLNPPGNSKPEIMIGKDESAYCLRKGDRVIQIKNNYTLGVFNGTSGCIIDIDLKERTVSVDFSASGDNRVVEYPPEFQKQLRLSYAISVHKSQGSEFPCVVIPIHLINRRMLQQNLLYTAITRGKEYVFIVGTEEAIEYAIDNDKPVRRNTLLKQFLKNAMEPVN